MASAAAATTTTTTTPTHSSSSSIRTHRFKPSIHLPFRFRKFTPTYPSVSSLAISCTISTRDPPELRMDDNGSSTRLQRPDSFGRFGKFGGKYVPETLMHALSELESAFHALAGDHEFQVLSRISIVFGSVESLGKRKRVNFSWGWKWNAWSFVWIFSVGIDKTLKLNLNCLMWYLLWGLDNLFEKKELILWDLLGFFIFEYLFSILVCFLCFGCVWFCWKFGKRN